MSMYPWDVRMAAQHFDHWISKYFNLCNRKRGEHGPMWTKEFHQYFYDTIYKYLEERCNYDSEACAKYAEYIRYREYSRRRSGRPDLFTTRAQRASARAMKVGKELGVFNLSAFMHDAQQHGLQEAVRMHEEQEYLSEIAEGLLLDSDPEDQLPREAMKS